MGLPAKMAYDCFNRDGWHCLHCRCSNNLHPHHITFRSQGGTDTLDNLVTLCMNCHRDVHDGKIIVYKYEVCSKFEGSYTVGFRRAK